MKGSDYCGAHNKEHLEKNRCSATTRRGEQCKGGSIRGTPFCLTHTEHTVGVAQVNSRQGVFDMAYREYLRSPQWRYKRRKRLDFDGHACVLCKSMDRLEVHHLSYDRLGHELHTDLRTLCHDCHDAVSDAERTLGHEQANEIFYTNYRRKKRRKRVAGR